MSTTNRKSTTTTTRKIETFYNVVDIAKSVQSVMGITREPSNKDTGATGRYNTWSTEQRQYNEQTVKPYRLNVATAIYTALDTLLNGYNVTDTDRAIIDNLLANGMETYLTKCPEVLKHATVTAKETTPTKVTDNTVIDYLVNVKGIARDIAEKMVK